MLLRKEKRKGHYIRSRKMDTVHLPLCFLEMFIITPNGNYKMEQQNLFYLN